MSTTIGAANIRVGADITGLLSGMKEATAIMQQSVRSMNTSMAASYRQADTEMRVFRNGLNRLGDEITDIGKKWTKLGTLPMLFGAGYAYKEFADIQKLNIGLEQYGETLQTVKELARLPNIGIEGAAKSLISLRSVRMETELAQRAIKSFANALTAAGKSSVDLDPALYNITQMMSTGKISAVDIKEMANRVPQARQAIIDAFGTADSEALNKIGVDKVINGLITQLEKIPPVAGGAGMAMEKFGDNSKLALATIGESLDNTFNITGKIEGVADAIEEFAENFRMLDKGTRDTVLTVGALAAAIPPVMIGIGSLVKFIPMIATGFGLISWPVAAVVATGVAIGGLIAVMPVLNNQVAELKKQQQTVADFSGKLKPLVDRYNELKGIVKPNVEQSAELKKVIGDISNLVPTSVTAFDSYGKAIDINTSKTKEFTDQQEKLLKSMQAVRRETLIAENNKSNYRKQELQQKLNSGSSSSTIYLGMGQYVTQTYKLGADEIKKYSAELSELHEQDKKNRKELLSLGGVELYQAEVKKLSQMYAAKTKLSEQYKQALKDENIYLLNSINSKSAALSKDIANQEAKVRPMVAMWNLAKKEAREAASANAKAVAEVGKATPPVKKANDDLNKSYKEGVEILTKHQQVTKDYVALLVAMSGLKKIEAPGFKDMSFDHIKPKVSPYASYEVGMAGSINKIKETKISISDIFDETWSGGDVAKLMDAIPRSLGENYDDYYKRLSLFRDAADQAGAKISSSLRDMAQSAAVGFGEMLGSMSTGISGIESFGQKILAGFGSMMKELGKTMIGFGTAGIAAKKFITNPYTALAAGIGLVALGTALTNRMTQIQDSGPKVKLAKGGMAFGEVTALVGDNPNARFDPEIIAPYSKIHESIRKSIGENGGTGGYQQIYARIDGEDIVLAWERTKERKASIFGTRG